MTVIIDGTSGIDNNATDLSYTGTLTGGTGVVNLGAGQVYKDASGNVGIGQAPASGVLLDLKQPTAGTDLIIGLSAGTGARAQIRSIAQGSANDSAISFQTTSGGSTNERARIDSSGNLLVGTTSVDAAGSKIQLSSSQNRVFTIQNTANVNGDQALWLKLGTNCNTAASPAFICDTGGTNKLIIWGNGNVVNTNNSYGAISDIKLKENIVDATPKLEKLNQIRIVNYNLIGEEQKQLGVIAQELEQLFPGMIDETPDRDVEGIDLGTTTKSVKYSVFVPMLIKAIQEQQTLIVSLQDTLTALNERLTALEQE